MALIADSFNSSTRATGTPSWRIAMTEATASPMESNAHTPAEISSGMPRSRSVASVITPSVPSEPTNSLVRS
jgi:hypothetical protein